MDDNEEQRRYGDSTILEPIVEQQDDEMTTSPMSSSSTDADFLEEERRIREEVQQFEQLEKELSSTRRGVRVKFDDEHLPSMSQTTVIKTEPCFQINSTEDQVTKHFYQNEFPNNQISLKTPSEPDSLEEEYIIAFKPSFKTNTTQREIYHKITDSSPGKSILKKSQKRENFDQSSISRSPSPSLSSSRKKQSTSSRSDCNQVQHLAEATAKQITSQSNTPPRSLFEPTINIFDSSNSSHTRRPSRLRYYIKPYRGEVYIPPDLNKERSRSLSEQRLGQQSGPIVGYRPFNRKYHVSWSPVRDYIYQGREQPKIKENSPSLISTRSSSSPCLRNSSSSMIPISMRYQSPQRFRYSSSIDSYETSSTIPTSQYEEKKEMIFVSPLPDIIHPNKKEHNETMQRYDRLLEKMRATDEQLQTLSRSWTNKTQHRTSLRSNLTLNKTNNEFFSPMILQICLIILVIFNLIVVYFFNEINVLWSQYVGHTVITEQHDEGTTNF